MVFKKLKKRWKSLDNLPRGPRNWNKFYRISKYLLLIFGLIITTLPTYFNYLSVSYVYDGLYIPNYDRESEYKIYLNFSDPTNVEIKIPYKIENLGYTDITNIKLDFLLILSVSTFAEFIYLKRKKIKKDFQKSKKKIDKIIKKLRI